MTRHDGNGGVMGAKPTRHEFNGLTAGGALGIIVVWALITKGIPITEPVAAAIGTLCAQVTQYASTWIPRLIKR